MDPTSFDLPVLPIRNAVLFPAISMPLIVGRERSLKALDQSQACGNLLVVVTQRVLTHSDPEIEDLFSIGTLCKVESIIPTESGNRQAVVTGIARYRIEECHLSPAGFMFVRGEIVPDIHGNNSVRNEALFHNLRESAREIAGLIPEVTEPLLKIIERVDDPSYLCNICSAYLNLTLHQKQELLETSLIEQRMEVLLNIMKKEREILDIQKEIREKMSERLNKAQREAILREQLKTIRTELGEEGGEDAVDDLDERLRKAELPEEASRQANEELKRLRNLPPTAAEYHVIRTYLEWLSALPWKKQISPPINLIRARKILDEDHYGIEDVKRRILQFLAVAKLKNNLHGPILCLLGPPGVGKTSLGQSIARALDRKFIHASLGGVRDESEVRGHRRTYVGAMPGRIIQSIKRAGTSNPLIMLDEIDKLRTDFHGDPSSAMLEVLDPEQNKFFMDHYIDTAFDLSQVFFITTANVLDAVPHALRDRMEIIEVHGYTSFEKLQIAKNFLAPKLLTAHGLSSDQVELPDETLQKIISHYTREAGVRELERKIAALLRSSAEKIVNEEVKCPPAIVSRPETLIESLGPERYFPEIAERGLKAGVSMGLCWTPFGGELLYIEAKAMPTGKGHLILTGQLGDVMKESAQIALSLARSMVGTYLLRKFDFNSNDIHIHVPGGSIPKDGPSAGISIFSSLVSLVLSQPIHPDLAMTGEITLRGAVLAVGGIKEKILAAHRAGLSRILLPKKNQADLQYIPDTVRKSLQFFWMDTVEDALEHLGLAISPPPVRSIASLSSNLALRREPNP